METIIQLFYIPTLHIIICGDINTNYLMESEKINQLDNLLLSHTLTNIINFPTRVQNTFATAVGNVFIDISQFVSYTIASILSGLSDDDDDGAQLLMFSAGGK